MNIVIVGAGGFGREVLWTLNDCNKSSKKYKILGFIDDNKRLHGKFIEDLPVLGGLEWFSKKVNDTYCVVAIGDPKSRKQIIEKLKAKNVKFPVIMHPSVHCSDSVTIGEGTIVQADSIITVNIKIGSHVHINLDCTIGHDCNIEDFVTLCPGSHISGRTKIETGVFVGTGTVTKEKINIGKWSVIGAGTVLIDNVSPFSMYAGVPGKMKKKIKKLTKI